MVVDRYDFMRYSDCEMRIKCHIAFTHPTRRDDDDEHDTGNMVKFTF